MPRFLSRFPTLVAVALVLTFAAHRTDANPIRLAEPDRVPLNSTALVVADLDGTHGPDLIGTDGSNVLAALNDGSGHFGAALSFPLGTSLLAVAVADLDGNGLVDLVGVGSQIFVRLQTSAMVFGPAQAFALPAGIRWGFVLADFNHDGRPDFAGNCAGSCVTIEMNDGSGHFGPAIQISVPSGVSRPVAGDFDGDGNIDIVLGANLPGDIQLDFIPGHGDGTFGPPVTALHHATVIVHLVPADFDGDGVLDVVATNESNLGVCRGRGDGTFENAISLGALGRIYFDPAVGDMDGDGRPDIAISRWEDWFGPIGKLTTYRNAGGFTFERPVHFKISPSPGDVALADIDGDGRMDAAVICALSGESCFTSSDPAVALLRNPDGGPWNSMYQADESVWLPVRRVGRAVPDLVGATTSGVLMLARNRGHGFFAPAVAAGRGLPLAARDFDGDGNDDLVVTSGDSLSVLLGLGDAGFGVPVFTAPGFTFRDIGDFDHDHRADLLTTSADSELVSFAGDGTGHFGPAIPLGVHVEVSRDADEVRAADVDRDGWDDVLYATFQKATVYGEPDTEYLILLRNDHSGGFASPESSMAAVANHGPGCLRLGDWSGDGNLDALHVHLGCTSGDYESTVGFLGLGNGAFHAMDVGTGRASWCDAGLADLNGDHLDDLVLLDSTAGCWFHAFTLASAGPEGFAEGAAYSMGVEPNEVFFTDVDGDGRLDVVTHDERYVTSYAIRRNLTVPPVPTPTLASLVAARVEDGVVHLTWFASGRVATAGVERREATGGWSLLGETVSDGTGFFRFDDPAVTAGARYSYRLRMAGTGVVSAETWIDVPASAFRIEGVRPNPASSHPVLAFAIPSPGEAEVRVYDVMGRQVHRERLSGLTAGGHLVDLGRTPLRPGLYAATLDFQNQRLRTRFLVIP